MRALVCRGALFKGVWGFGIAPLAALSLGCREVPRESPVGDAGPTPSGVPAVSASGAEPAPGDGGLAGGGPLGDAQPSRDAGTERDPSRVVLLFGGDINLGRGTGQRILRDPEYAPLRFLKPVFDSADLRVMNLESQLSDQGGETQSKHNSLVFTGPPGGAEVLKAAGVEWVSLANNHAWDYGKSALFETFTNLERAGVGYVGASREPGSQAYEPARTVVRGLPIALFSVTHIWNQGPINEHPGRLHVAWAEFSKLAPRIAAAKARGELVILLYHGGAEYVDAPMTWTRDFVRASMKAGVDAFIGHHPHVPQGVGFAGTRPVFYSLGNLVFPMHKDHPATGTGFLARLSYQLTGGAPELASVEACPYFILGHVPKPFDDAAAPARYAALRQRLNLTSRAVGGSVVGEPGEDGCLPLSPPERSGPGAPLGWTAPRRAAP
ncbi:MAG: CapA family protein [Polyangiaceae bacterium]|nr:CapA family protein [Polyangiaceae bacterium]MCW5790231.1 CapA family protein [Polyangiaceae bacterium]